MMEQSQTNKQKYAFVCLALLLFVAGVECQRNRQNNARRIENNGSFRSSCGNGNQVAGRIGRCLDPVFEMVEGKIKEPNTDQDMIGNCDRFGYAEKCVRGISKDCLSGLHKTTTSSISSATKRFRTQECKTEASRARYKDPLRCTLKHPREIVSIYKNHTAIAQAIRDLPITPEEKLIRTCCMLIALDKALEDKYNGYCPSATPLVLGIVHAMTDDARATLCRSPRCAGTLDDIVKSPLKQQQNIIEPVMEILFMLRTD